MENKVLSPEELSKLQSIENKRGELVERFGIIEINIQDLKLQKELIIKELSELKTTELDFGVLLQQKYGEVNVNLSTGEIISR
jgi:hypothetical protein